MQDFSIAEDVLCYQRDSVYAAKILKVDRGDEKNGAQYLIHYKGWKKRWDEWVSPSRLLKDNEDNRALQTSMDTLAKATEARSRPTASSTSGQSPSSRKKADGRFTKCQQDGPDQNLREMKLDIPAQVKARLINDRDTVMKDKKLVILPRSPTVRELLKEFETYVKDTRPVHLKDPLLLIPAVVSGIKVYFDCSLGNHLLYHPERPQYRNAILNIFLSAAISTLQPPHCHSSAYYNSCFTNACAGQRQWCVALHVL
ncbi:MRG-domain-containing protein [Mycena leptocephala]|nr:MRG-domain-containing protein [Mycena leptocephala]